MKDNKTSYNFFFIILAVVTLFHPHLRQKVDMLYDYFTHENYQFWTTFKPIDVVDLVMHSAMPIVFLWLGMKGGVQKEEDGKASV